MITFAVLSDASYDTKWSLITEHIITQHYK